MHKIDSKDIILIVDDSADSLGMLNEALIAEDYTIFVAMDGEQALSIANRMAPDLILMDVLMPKMDGVEACRKLKENSDLCDVPVIFMTGLSDSEHVILGLEAGGVDYINKPVNIDELVARIKVHLKNAKLTRSARGALNEIGPLSFTCDVNGQLLWLTQSARDLLDEAGADSQLLENDLPKQIRTWLAHKPDRLNSFSFKGLKNPIQISFMGQSTPGEYLLRILDDDELSNRKALKNRFLLTEREAEVLFWLTRGKTNREIGQILSTSPRTVNKHLEPVFKKLQVENRTTAVAICLQYLNNR